MGGGSIGGGGFHGVSGGGMVAGGGYRGGVAVSGARGVAVSGYHGVAVSGYHGYGHYGGYGYRGCCGYYPWYGFGFGYGYWPGYYSYPYYGYAYPYGYSYGYPSASYAYPAYSYDSSYYSQPSYQPSPNVTVIYPPAQSGTPQGGAVYDGYGQPTRPAPSSGIPSNDNNSPIYLIAMRDHTIQPAAAYWVTDGTLHYVTLDHVEKQVALNDLDREMTLRLNRERHVSMQLFPQ
jgi:hypothetical protein